MYVAQGPGVDGVYPYSNPSGTDNTTDKAGDSDELDTAFTDDDSDSDTDVDLDTTGDAAPAAGTDTDTAVQGSDTQNSSNNGDSTDSQDSTSGSGGSGDSGGTTVPESFDSVDGYNSRMSNIDADDADSFAALSSSIGEDMSILQGQIDETENSITTIENGEKAAAETDLANARADYIAAESGYTDTVADIEELTSQIGTAYEVVEDALIASRDAYAIYNSLKNSESATESEVDAAKARWEEAEAAKAEADAAVQELEGQMTVLEGDKAVYEENMEAALAAQGEAQVRIDDCETAIGKLQDTQAAYEAEYEALKITKTEVDGKYEAAVAAAAQNTGNSGASGNASGTGSASGNYSGADSADSADSAGGAENASGTDSTDGAPSSSVTVPGGANLVEEALITGDTSMLDAYGTDSQILDYTLNIFGGELVAEDLDLAAGLTVEEALDEASAALDQKTAEATYSKSSAIAKADTATSSEHSDSEAAFTAAVLDARETLSSGEFTLNVVDQSTLETAEYMLDRIQDGEYIKTSELDKAASQVENFNFETVDNTDTDARFEQYGTAILSALEGMISDTDTGAVPEDDTSEAQDMSETEVLPEADGTSDNSQEAQDNENGGISQTLTQDDYDGIEAAYREKLNTSPKEALQYLMDEAPKYGLTEVTVAV